MEVLLLQSGETWSLLQWAHVAQRESVFEGHSEHSCNLADQSDEAAERSVALVLFGLNAEGKVRTTYAGQFCESKAA